MKQNERAKQFLPFDTLKGLREELKKREERHTRIEKRELSEEMKEEISTVLKILTTGTEISITFYYIGHYVETVAVVEKINYECKYLTINGNKIPFDDIRSIYITL